MEKILVDHLWIVILIVVWTLPWKAVALWKSARRGQMGWFLALLLLNTLAILDIFYLIFFTKGHEKKAEPEIEQPTYPNNKSFYGEQHKFSTSSKSRSAII